MKVSERHHGMVSTSLHFLIATYKCRCAVDNEMGIIWHIFARCTWVHKKLLRCVKPTLKMLQGLTPGQRER